MGELAEMNATGDTKVVWSANNRDEVDNARRTFDDLRAKGFVGYSVKKNGDKNEVIHTFDAEAERIIMAPPMVGG